MGCSLKFLLLYQLLLKGQQDFLFCRMSQEKVRTEPTANPNGESSQGEKDGKAMRLHYNSIYLGHETGMHPENPKRLELFQGLEEMPVFNGEDFLPLVHSEEYIDKVKRASAVGGHIDPDTVTSPGTYAAAVHAVGATLQAAVYKDFALVRPPGHHAYPRHAGGFCLFNNIAVAARQLANEGKRVLILDFDGHLGDGTCEIFYDTDEVMYWSVHQYPAFPGHGFVDEIGRGKGEGFTINLPLPPGSADDIYLDAIKASLSIAKQFQPDVVALSAGFDAHQYDLLLDLKVSHTGFYELGQLLREQFDNMFATLEGGYNVVELHKGVNSFLAGMNGEPNPNPEEKTISGLRVWETYEINLHAALGRLHKFWKP